MGAHATAVYGRDPPGRSRPGREAGVDGASVRHAPASRRAPSWARAARPSWEPAGGYASLGTESCAKATERSAPLPRAVRSVPRVFLEPCPGDAGVTALLVHVSRIDPGGHGGHGIRRGRCDVLCADLPPRARPAARGRDRHRSDHRGVRVCERGVRVRPQEAHRLQAGRRAAHGHGARRDLRKLGVGARARFAAQGDPGNGADRCGGDLSAREA